MSKRLLFAVTFSLLSCGDFERQVYNMSAASTEHPKYKMKAFATSETAEEWLNQCAEQAYHFKSMASIEATNHFSKELEGLMWVVVERDEVPAE